MNRTTLSASIDINHVYSQIYIQEVGPCQCSIRNDEHKMFNYYFQQGLKAGGLRFNGMVCVADETEALWVVMRMYKDKTKDNTDGTIKADNG